MARPHCRLSSARSGCEHYSHARSARAAVGDHIEGNGQRFYQEASQLGVEGVISKRIDRPYVPGNRGLWLKLKCLIREEFIVVSWTEPAGSRPYFGALLLGYYTQDGAAAPGAPRTKWRMGMSKVKLSIQVAPGADYGVEVSSETIAKDELAREIIDVLRRHFPMSGTSMIYDQARSRLPYDDLHRIGFLNRRTKWTW